jgi:hypothetical protein
MDITLPVPAKPTDISNTLQTIYNVRNQREDNELARQRFRAEQESKNALQIHNANVEKRLADKDARDKGKEDLDMFGKSVNYIAAIPDPVRKEKEYDNFVRNMLSSGKGSPLGFLPVDVFKNADGTWNDDKFNKWAKDTHYAVTATLDPKEGTRIKQTINNPKFNRDATESEDNPRFIEVHTVIKNGKQTLDPDAPVTPVINPFTTQETTERGVAVRERAEDRLADRDERKANAPKSGGPTGTWRYDYTNGEGYPVYTNTKTGVTRVGDIKASPKPSAKSNPDDGLDKLLPGGTPSPNPPSESSYTVGGMYNGKKILGINRATKELNVEGTGRVKYN